MLSDPAFRVIDAPPPPPAFCEAMKAPLVSRALPPTSIRMGPAPAPPALLNTPVGTVPPLVASICSAPALTYRPPVAWPALLNAVISPPACRVTVPSPELNAPLRGTSTACAPVAITRTSPVVFASAAY